MFSSYHSHAILLTTMGFTLFSCHFLPILWFASLGIHFLKKVVMMRTAVSCSKCKKEE